MKKCQLAKTRPRDPIQKSKRQRHPWQVRQRRQPWQRYRRQLFRRQLQRTLYRRLTIRITMRIHNNRQHLSKINHIRKK